jgi:Putative peptidoglycan binding domain
MNDTPPTLDSFAEYLNEASQGGHLPNPYLEVDGDEDTNLANTKSYIKAIRSRLIDLGYLEESTKNRSRDFLDDTLKKAIKHFQAESGLETDCWVGENTWSTLQQLVSFENDQDPREWSEWLQKDSNQPAILRAVYLRLYVLGFFKWNQKLKKDTELSIRKNKDFQKALREFLQFALELKLIEGDFFPVISMVNLRALFQQDEIIHALKREHDFVLLTKNKKVVESIARIELWMLGFDVGLGSPRFQYKKRKEEKVKDRLISLPDALAQFWEQQPKKLRPLTSFEKETITSHFFEQLVKFEKEDREPDEFVEENIVERINDFSKNERNELTKRLTNIAGSIWDGVKRVFRWIKRLLKKTIKKFVSVTFTEIKNIARLISKKARRAFRTVQKAFEIVYRGSVYFKKKLLPGSDARHIAIYHDKDFDAKVFLNLDAESGEVQRVMYKNRLDSVCFGAACRILSHLVGILKSVVKTFVTGFAGWFFVLVALSKMAIRIKEIIEEVNLVEKFEVERYASPFLNKAV